MTAQTNRMRRRFVLEEAVAIHGERTDWVPRARIILEHGEARAFHTFDRFAQFAPAVLGRRRPLAGLSADHQRSAGLIFDRFPTDAKEVQLPNVAYDVCPPTPAIVVHTRKAPSIAPVSSIRREVGQ